MSLAAILAGAAFWIASLLAAAVSDQHVCVIEDPASHRAIKVMTDQPCPPRATHISED